MSGHAPFDLGGPLPTGRFAIEASAGTGKTFTLAALAARFVAERDLAVSELLVVTFTRAAAAELRDRIRSRILLSAQVLAGRVTPAPDDAALAALCSRDVELRRRRLEQALADFDTATITTIHGFAQQALAALGLASPGDADAALVDDTGDLVAQACADVLASAAVLDPSAAVLLPDAGRLEKLATTVLQNPGIAVVPAHGEAAGRAATARTALDQALALVHERRRLAGTRSFDDVLTQLAEALEAGERASEALRRRFPLALVDEFQDTDPVQWRIFSRLSSGAGGATLVLVGDPKQAIYAFRGADVRTYLDAVSSATGHATLATNRRASGALVGALDRLLAGTTFGDDRIAFSPVEVAPGNAGATTVGRDGAARAPLSIRLALGPGIARTTRGQVETASAEAAIAEDLVFYVQELLESCEVPARDGRRRARPTDVAVLVGTHAEARFAQEALVRRGVPAVVTRGASVLGSRSATEWRHLLAAIGSPGDRALARLVALSPWFGWRADRLDKAGDDELAEVHDALARWSQLLSSHGPVAACRSILEESGVVARLLATADGDRDVTDLVHVASLLQSGLAARKRSASGLLAALDELGASHPASAEEDLTARQVESEADAVQVMTVYTAKGLEFPVVCVPTLWRGSRARSRSPVFHDEATGRRVLDAAPGEAWPDRRASEARHELASSEARAENLRLVYVALTRARFETVVWWARAQESDATGLARVLFARGPDGIEPDRFRAQRVALPDDADAAAFLAAALGPGSGVAVAEIGLGPSRAPRRRPGTAAGPPPTLEVSTLHRTLDRSSTRWSFTSVVARGELASADPADDALGDRSAADELDRDDRASVSSGSDLPLGNVPGGAEFGTLVHEVLERVDFSADDLDGEIAAAVDERIARNPWPVGRDELVSGLRRAIETPLGPILGGRRLRDFPRSDRLDELGFELHLARRGARATEREVGALVASHLPPGAPLRAWAATLASGVFDVELAGHLTGSIDLVLRVRGASPGADRYVVADYKTNTLGPRSRPPRAADYDTPALASAMAAHHYPLQALLYCVALHRYLRWRVPGYEPARHLGGAAYLFVRAMTGPLSSDAAGVAPGVFPFEVPPALVTELSELLDGAGARSGGAR